MAEGDQLRITHGGRTADNEHRLETGSTYAVKRFDKEGNIVLANGWVVDKDFGHLSHAYVSTSHASQGKTYQRVLVAQGARQLCGVIERTVLRLDVAGH